MQGTKVRRPETHVSEIAAHRGSVMKGRSAGEAVVDRVHEAERLTD